MIEMCELGLFRYNVYLSRDAIKVLLLQTDFPGGAAGPLADLRDRPFAFSCPATFLP